MSGSSVSSPREKRSLFSSFRTVDWVYTAIAAVLIALCSWVSIPSVVPFTLQTFAVFLIVSLLGPRRGTLAVLVYLLLGAVGIPVFSGFSGGIAALLGPTGGYLIGFLLLPLPYALVLRAAGRKPLTEMLGLALGLLLCYALGTAWFMVVYARTKGPVALGTVLSWCVLPFLLPDVGKLLLALLLSRRIRPALKL